MIKGQKMPEEQRLKMIGNIRGAGNKGHRHTEATKRVLSQKTSASMTAERRAQISEQQKEHPGPTKEHQQKIAEARWGGGTKEERFLRRIRKTRGCWHWQGVVHPNGYGIYQQNRKAHRVAYEMFVGPIKSDNHIHHICHNKLCVKPAHLEQVSGPDHKFIHSRPDGWERYLYKKALR